MTNDDSERKSSGSANSAPDGHRTDTTLSTAIEASLQAGLRSVSDALRGLGAGDSTVTPPSVRTPARRPSAGRSRDTRSDTASNTPRTEATDPAADECLIDTRHTEDEFIVTADIPSASKDEVAAGINPQTNELVIKKTDTVVGRVDLPWPAPETTDAWFHNGILEVHMRAADAESPE